MRAAVRYTLYRFALFAAAYGVLYLVGARGLLLVALALVTSGLVSYVVLSAQRDAFSHVISEKLGKAGQQVDAGATAEDDAAAEAAADEQRRES